MSKPSKQFTIKDWYESYRTREKFQQQGASFLSNAELIAILILAVGVYPKALLNLPSEF